MGIVVSGVCDHPCVLDELIAKEELRANDGDLGTVEGDAEHLLDPASLDDLGVVVEHDEVLPRGLRGAKVYE